VHTLAQIATLSAIATHVTGERSIEVGNRRRALALGQRPGFVMTTRMRGLSGRPMGVGGRRGAPAARRAGVGHRTQASPSGRMGCDDTYDSPPVLVGPDGCDIGYNGCGDTIGVNVNIAGNTTVDVNIPAAIEFTPRYFIYTGALATFTIDRIFVANGPNSNFGAGYSADYYALTSFTSKRVSWPTFYNSPALSITTTNVTGQEAAFLGLLIGVASHQ